MKERLLIKNETKLVIPSHVQFGYNETRKEWVMNAPERTLYPCKIAVEVLKKCNGNLNIEKIAEELATLYKAPIKKISKDIKIMLQDLADKGFLECQTN
jgi:pyrroloquinoline quinone biosynthesis protein D